MFCCPGGIRLQCSSLFRMTEGVQLLAYNVVKPRGSGVENVPVAKRGNIVSENKGSRMPTIIN